MSKSLDRSKRPTKNCKLVSHRGCRRWFKTTVMRQSSRLERRATTIWANTRCPLLQRLNRISRKSLGSRLLLTKKTAAVKKKDKWSSRSDDP